MKCAVEGCLFSLQPKIRKKYLKGRPIKNPHFFYLPKDLPRLDVWIKQLNLKNIKSGTKVCELHFKEDSITRSTNKEVTDENNNVKHRVYLKKDVMPTVHLNFNYVIPGIIEAKTSQDSLRSIDNEIVIEEIQDVGEDVIFEQTQSVFKEGVEVISFNSILTEITMVDNWMAQQFVRDGRKNIFLFFIEDNFTIIKRIHVLDSMTYKIFINDKCVKISQLPLQNKKDLENLLRLAESLVHCTFNLKSKKCKGITEDETSLYCSTCQTINNNKNQLKKKTKNNINALIYYKKKTSKLQNKVTVLTKEKKEDDKFKNFDLLPEGQKLVVTTCLEATTKQSKTIRFDSKFLYECILLRIKSKRAYNHILNTKLIHIPTIKTIQRQMKNLDSAFGYNMVVLNTLKEKIIEMPEEERRGVLIMDEMALTPSVAFNRTKLKTTGFTDLGDYTPENQKEELGDHALVMMIQPFRGKWVQTIGSFLSKGAAQGSTLYSLVIEAVILLENAGFHVDGIVTDGATWNRNMFSLFGATPQSPSCQHIVDPTRRLWFFSDPPHLFKNIWGWITKHPCIEIPQGTIKLKHWEAVFYKEQNLSLKACPRLNQSHIFPTKYELMNSGRAYLFFSFELYTAMLMYKEEVKELEDCDATLFFIKKMYSLIKAFNSRSSKGALNLTCTEMNDIKDFLQFIQKDPPIASKETLKGLKITLTSTIELTEYLIKKIGYKFVIATRFNQDNIEKFFGMLRGSCGNNDHPNPAMFLTIFRIMTTYNLIQPIKGSNVTGDELIESLLSPVHLSTKDKDQWAVIKKKIVNSSDAETQSTISLPKQSKTSEEIMSYVAGFVAKKACKFKNCGDCWAKLTTKSKATETLLASRDLYGALHHPSDDLKNLLRLLEMSIMNEVGEERRLKPDTFFSIVRYIEENVTLNQVGCEIHYTEVTEFVVNYYLIFRMDLLCKEVNANIKSASKNKMLKKVGKVITPKANPCGKKNKLGAKKLKKALLKKK